ncbi:hypothetical protein DYBT9275_04697 [Dyadobacter sp. CECT 9275]|uniref:Outer membrane protein beta-barrel domain-containing protein n=1 Tax=Dyadobacter helix TaxID=2822344 RepID=A0A916JG87_9BACT|nr:hypothetical protein [Dyadobacter sp. CECT 9275]CAG5010343.1 hypothetical protein DYBT9275_04697 [Dyadobacter sp. CECT 9275]
MKKIFLMLFVAAILGFTSGKAFAQFEKGDKLVNVGLNLGGGDGFGGGIGLGASYEQGIHDFISVGAQADFVTWKYGYFGYNWRYNFFTVAARGSYHFGKHFLTMDKLDLYAGPVLGYTIANYSAPGGYSGIYENNYGSGVTVGVFAGARYYFKPTTAVFAELGGGNRSFVPLKVGITFKF